MEQLRKELVSNKRTAGAISALGGVGIVACVVMFFMLPTAVPAEPPIAEVLVSTTEVPQVTNARSATYLSAYDADTIRFDVDMGLEIQLSNQAVRVEGIDAYEVRGSEREQGLQARDWVRTELQTASTIRLLFTGSRGKYGRWIAQVWYTRGGMWYNLGKELVGKGLAVEKEY